MYASQPTKASSATSGPVRQPKEPTIGNSMLEGKTPLSTYGNHPEPTGNPHVKTGPAAFSTPMHNYGSGGMAGAAVTHESRGGTGGIPHVSMHP